LQPAFFCVKYAIRLAYFYACPIDEELQ